MSAKTPAPPTKVLDALLASLEKAAVHNTNAHVAPAAILWPDQGEHNLTLAQKRDVRKRALRLAREPENV